MGKHGCREKAFSGLEWNGGYFSFIMLVFIRLVIMHAWSFFAHVTCMLWKAFPESSTVAY